MWLWKHFYWMVDLAMIVAVIVAIICILKGEIGGALFSGAVLVGLGLLTGWGGRR